jgi:hypothetical protein
MNSFDYYVGFAVAYLDAVYRIEVMNADGVFGLYGLEQNRIDKHGDLCDALKIDRDKTKDICLNLDKSIGFNIEDLNNDYEFYIEKFAKRLVTKLGMIQ